MTGSTVFAKFLGCAIFAKISPVSANFVHEMPPRNRLLVDHVHERNAGYRLYPLAYTSKNVFHERLVVVLLPVLEFHGNLLRAQCSTFQIEDSAMLTSTVH